MLRTVLQQNPSMLQGLLQQIGQSNPRLLQVWLPRVPVQHIPTLSILSLPFFLSFPASTPPHPPSLQVISQNQQAFIDLLNEAEPPASGQPPAPGGAAGGLGQAVPGVPPGAAGPMTIQVTPQQKEAIERVSVYFKIGAYQLGVESRQDLLQD